MHRPGGRQEQKREARFPMVVKVKVKREKRILGQVEVGET
jgi:hypothetical protein